MPRRMILAPGHDPHRSLGWASVSWIEYFVRHGPGDVQGQNVVHGEEFTEFIVNLYAVNERAQNNHLTYDSGFLSRPKAGPAAALVVAGPAREGLRQERHRRKAVPVGGVRAGAVRRVGAGRGDRP